MIGFLKIKEKAMIFSVDLRERVLAAKDDGMDVAEITKVFKVSRRAIYDWITLRKKTKSLAPKTGYQKGHSHKVKDWKQFTLFAEDNKHRTLEEMTVEWQKITNDSISISVMSKALKKIGYTSKKNLWIHRG
jgi:transposase